MYFHKAKSEQDQPTRFFFKIVIFDEGDDDDDDSIDMMISKATDMFGN